MKVDGKHFRSIWLDEDGWSVGAIDQRKLPHEFVVARLTTCDEAAEAIRSMLVRGAPLDTPQRRCRGIKRQDVGAFSAAW